MWCSDAEATSERRLSLVSLCVPVSLLGQNQEATTITQGGRKVCQVTTETTQGKYTEGAAGDVMTLDRCEY